MGTNYYAIKTHPIEETAFQKPVTQHIGKSSAGWCFSLCVNTFKSLEEWIIIFNDPSITIIDEYGANIDPSTMVQIITERSWQKRPDWWESKSMLGPNNLLRHQIDNSHCIGHGEGTFDLIIGEFC